MQATGTAVPDPGVSRLLWIAAPVDRGDDPSDEAAVSGRRRQRTAVGTACRGVGRAVARCSPGHGSRGSSVRSSRRWPAGVGVFALVSGEDEVEVAGTTTTSTTTTTTTDVPEGRGRPADRDPTARRGRRPAGAPGAGGEGRQRPRGTPQQGLEAADLVVELRVEGISRFMAVFHSRDVDRVGPTRSARTSDPDLLAMFGRPLFAWSGGNASVAEVIRTTPWIQDIGFDRLSDAYTRDRSRSRPHNLMFAPADGFAVAEEPVTPPAPIFTYAAPDAPRAGVPAPGVAVSVGRSASTYRWDPDRAGWARNAAGRRPQRRGRRTAGSREPGRARDAVPTLVGGPQIAGGGDGRVGGGMGVQRRTAGRGPMGPSGPSPRLGAEHRGRRTHRAQPGIQLDRARRAGSGSAGAGCPTRSPRRPRRDRRHVPRSASTARTASEPRHLRR